LRRLRRIPAALLLIVAAVTVLWASPAGAHASLSSSDPADGSTVEELPGAVTLTFTEPVSLGVGGVEVLDASGEAVQDGEASVQDTVVTVDVPADLPDGTYVISYRVVSAD